MKELILNDLNEALAALKSFIENPAAIDSIAAAAEIMVDALGSGHKVISCGNGGSLCDATHFAEELTGRYRRIRPGFPAIALNDPAFLSCTANDYSYEEVFSRAIDSLGSSGDVLLAISTSGRSENVLRAVEAAHRHGIKVVALTALPSPLSRNPLSEVADVVISATASAYSDRIQEIHIKVIHILINLIENKLY